MIRSFGQPGPTQQSWCCFIGIVINDMKTYDRREAIKKILIQKEKLPVHFVSLFFGVVYGRHGDASFDVLFIDTDAFFLCWQATILCSEIM